MVTTDFLGPVINTLALAYRSPLMVDSETGSAGVHFYRPASDLSLWGFYIITMAFVTAIAIDWSH